MRARTKMSRAGSPEDTLAARKRYAAGRRIKVPRTIKTARDILRRHLKEEGWDQGDLAPVWDLKPSTVKRIFWETSRPLAPQHVDAFVEALKLDEFDAMELRWQAAIEAGWQLNARYMLREGENGKQRKSASPDRGT